MPGEDARAASIQQAVGGDLVVAEFFQDEISEPLISRVKRDDTASIASTTSAFSRISSSFVALRRTASILSTDSVDLDGTRPFSLVQLCDFISEHPSLQTAGIVSCSCYAQRSPLLVTHRFLVLQLRRPHKKDVWMRLDRRATPVGSARFLATAGVTPSNDSAKLAATREELVSSAAVRENELTFTVYTPLTTLRTILLIVKEELSYYRLTSENCWMFASLIQGNLLSRHSRFTLGGLKHAGLAPEVRLRVYHRLLVLRLSLDFTWTPLPVLLEKLLPKSSSPDARLPYEASINAAKAWEARPELNSSSGIKLANALADELSKVCYQIFLLSPDHRLPAQILALERALALDNNQHSVNRLNNVLYQYGRILTGSWSAREGVQSGWGWVCVVLTIWAVHYASEANVLHEGPNSTSNLAETMNDFLDRFWSDYEPVLSRFIQSSSAHQTSLSQDFIDLVVLGSMPIGTKPPKIKYIQMLERSSNNDITLACGFSIEASRSGEEPDRHIAESDVGIKRRQIDQIIGPASWSGVENISFDGELRIHLKLTGTFPPVRHVTFSMTAQPTTSYNLQPEQGSLSWSMPRDAIIAALDEIAHTTFIATKEARLNMNEMKLGVVRDSAIGVLELKLDSARNLVSDRGVNNPPNPYLVISIGNGSPLYTTNIIRNTVNPYFGVTRYVIVNNRNMTEDLVINLFDQHGRRADALLGTSRFALVGLLEDPCQEDVTPPLLRGPKDVGSVRFSVNYRPIKHTTSDELSAQPHRSNVGIVRLTIHQAKELDYSRSRSVDINPYAQLGFSSSTIHQTPSVKRSLSPIWESTTEFLVTDLSASIVTLKVLDSGDVLTDVQLGYMAVTLNDLLEACIEGREWFPLSSCKSGKVRMSLEWKPLEMAVTMKGSAAYVPPIGVIQLWIDQADDIKNVGSPFGGKMDPYLRVLLNGVIAGRTDAVVNSFNPSWNQILYIPVHSLREVLILEVMDYYPASNDRSLGYTELAVQDLTFKNSGDSESHPESTGKEVYRNFLRRQGDTFKGTLSFTAEFIPAFMMQDIRFKPPGEETSDTESDVDSNHDGVNEEGDMQENTRREASYTSEIEHERAFVPANLGAERKLSKSSHFSGFATSAVVDLSLDELVNEQSGVLLVHVTAGSLPQEGRVEILSDEAYWPSFTTERAKSKQARWDHVGEVFIKELDFSRLSLRLNSSEENGRNDIIAELRMDTKTFLEKSWNKECEFSLVGDGGVRDSASIRLLSKYVPVNVTLEARESITNMGLIRVCLLSAHDLWSDRGGRANPYAVFEVDGQAVFKSETQKKTLDPEWNEFFEIYVPSREALDFRVELFHSISFESDRSLGSTQIDVSSLEPFELQKATLPVLHPTYGVKGSVKIQLIYIPDIVSKSPQTTAQSVRARAIASPFEAVGSLARTIFSRNSSLSSVRTSSRSSYSKPSSSSFDVFDGSSTSITSSSTFVPGTPPDS